MAANKVTSKLEAYLSNKSDRDLIPVLILMTRQPASFLGPQDVDDEGILINRADGIAKMKSGVNEDQQSLRGFLTQNDVTEIKSFWINNTLGAEVPKRLIELIAKREDVRLVDLNVPVPVDSVIDGHAEMERKLAAGFTLANPPNPADLWNLQRISAPFLWEKKLTGSDVLIAVVDSGIDYHHQHLEGNMWVGPARYPNHGISFVEGEAPEYPMDDDGHGTWCAGVIAGKHTGVAPKATLLAVRVFSKTKDALPDPTWDGMQFAMELGCHVVSMSMGWSREEGPDYEFWRTNCNTMYKSGIVHVNSAGNKFKDRGNNPIPYNVKAPANCPPPRLHPSQKKLQAGGVTSAIACGASLESDVLHEQSSSGPCEWCDYPDKSLLKPELCAPGANIVTTGLGDSYYEKFSQTSAATAHVAGAMALLIQARLASGKGRISPAKLLEALEVTCDTMEGQTPANKQNGFGSGRIDLKCAYKYGQGKGWW